MGYYPLLRITIAEIYRRFPTPESCLKHIEKMRWKGKPQCPYCGSFKVTPLRKEIRHHCNRCNTSFSATVKTVFHHSHIDLQLWFLCITLMLNAKKGISARQLARDLGVSKNTAWSMAMRVRKAMFEQRKLLSGIVEMDETYVGGKPRRGFGRKGRGTHKTPVVGMLERGGHVRAKVVKNVSAKMLNSLVRGHVKLDTSKIITDEFGGYHRLQAFIEHQAVNHSVTYVDGQVHTNGIEGFWALLKRGITGQYHKVSIGHLPQYIEEFCYRYNHRKCDDLFGRTLEQFLCSR